MAIIEPAFAWLLEHASSRGRRCAPDTVRTYAEHIYDWFDTLEQSISTGARSMKISLAHIEIA
ncbi:hypothetical protein ACFSUK_34050 [Sphingobium scionense]